MAIIEQENTVSALQPRAPRVQRKHLRLRIENRTETSFVKNTIYEEQSKDDAA